MLSNKDKKICTTLNYIEHFLTLFFAVTVCISISAFAPLVDISKGIMSSIIGLNICAITAKFKKYKSITNKKKKKHYETALLAKINLDCIKGIIHRSITDPCIERNYCILDVLRKYDYMKEEINKFETS